MKRILKYSSILIFFFVLSCNNDDETIDTSPVAAFKVNELLINEGQPAIFTDLSFDQNISLLKSRLTNTTPSTVSNKRGFRLVRRP